MHLRDSTAGWGVVTRLLHWSMAVLILFQLGLGVWMTRAADLLARFAWTQTHKSWGTVIFALALVRLAWRLANRRRPPLPPGTPAWQSRAARLNHVALYGLMLALPISGWVTAAASPTQDLLQIPNLVFGLLPLPDPWVPGAPRVETVAGAVHRALAVALGLVLLIHVAAAVRHRLAGDGVLAGMLFGR